MVDGADMIRDDIQEMLEADYKRLDIKAKGDDAAYLKSKRIFSALISATRK